MSCNKYLGSTCTKDYLRKRWETDNSYQFLNPKCCYSVNSKLLWPLYILCCFCLLIAVAVLVAIFANIYLSDCDDYLEFRNKSVDLYTYLFLGLCVLAVIGFLIFMIFRSKDDDIKTNPNSP